MLWKRNICLGKTAPGEPNLHQGTPPPPPLSHLNSASMAKRLPSAPSTSAKKLTNLTFPPQYRAEQFPNDLYVLGELLFCKEADLRNHN